MRCKGGNFNGDSTQHTRTHIVGHRGEYELHLQKILRTIQNSILTIPRTNNPSQIR